MFDYEYNYGSTDPTHNCIPLARLHTETFDQPDSKEKRWIFTKSKHEVKC